MITRQLTIKEKGTNASVQTLLYFKSRTNAEKAPQETGDRYILEDDYKQRLSWDHYAMVLTDLIIEDKAMFEAQAEQAIEKIIGAKKTQDRIDADPLLKVWIAQQQRQQQGGPRMPQIAMPMQPPIQT